ncbi:protein of unassigned function [Methylobacterium oryzae CBMB20]|uniref:Protein of unassigned function n=1 Tax=Methylobacterium oryzae CBMB20 TaxID=693986 RepID=A0A089NRQ0_9HYPH|nr:protein of unassigned function [Methylobacterium oryzae CBMB20]
MSLSRSLEAELCPPILDQGAPINHDAAQHKSWMAISR